MSFKYQGTSEVAKQYKIKAKTWHDQRLLNCRHSFSVHIDLMCPVLVDNNATNRIRDIKYSSISALKCLDKLGLTFVSTLREPLATIG